MERERQFAGGAIATELLTSADSRLFRSGAMSVGLSLGLRSLRAVRMRCLWLRSSPRLRSSYVAPRVYVGALLPSVVNPKETAPGWRSEAASVAKAVHRDGSPELRLNLLLSD